MNAFYLGTHKPHWLWTESCRSLFPLFVSHTQLRKYKKLKPAIGPWALDSGGFSVVGKHGSWDSIQIPTYIAAVRRYIREIGQLVWAPPQDWMCEPQILQKTGLTILDHQRRTVASYIDLTNLAPDLPWIPVLQGWHKEDYLNCIDLYYKARIYLHELPLVGVGTICRRQGTKEALGILRSLWLQDIKIHAFGFKMEGIKMSSDWIESADSMAWSYHGRRRPPLEEHIGRHKNCANCFEYAAFWLGRLQEAKAC